jgi:hypothetical protein
MRMRPLTGLARFCGLATLSRKGERVTERVARAKVRSMDCDSAHYSPASMMAMTGPPPCGP